MRSALCSCKLSFINGSVHQHQAQDDLGPFLNFVNGVDQYSKRLGCLLLSLQASFGSSLVCFHVRGAPAEGQVLPHPPLYPPKNVENPSKTIPEGTLARKVS